MMEGHEWEVLRICFVQVLEDMAFMFAEVDTGGKALSPPARELGGCTDTDNTCKVGDTSEQDPPDKWWMIDISFSGPVSGDLALASNSAFMSSLAANILGNDVEEVSDEASMIDALKELLNIICGNFITSMMGSKAIFNLTIPSARPLVSPGEFSEVMNLVEAFNVEGAPVLLGLTLK